MADVANPIQEPRIERRTRAPLVSSSVPRESADFAVADDVLNILEEHQVSPAELRILLALRARDLELNTLAQLLGRSPTTIRRAAAALYARGLLRWRYLVTQAGRDKDEVLGITRSGRARISPLLAHELRA
jgi:DNA-binding MarR family transcriptional regulator